MPTSKQFQEAKKTEQDLEARGYHLKLNVSTPAKAQWYRQDGTPLPNLLPSDPHHRDKYYSRGWSLLPIKDEDIVPIQTRLVGVGKSDTSSTTNVVVLDNEEEVMSGTDTPTIGLTLPQGVSYAEAEAVLAAYYMNKDSMPEPVIKNHPHKFDKSIGSPCKIMGCMAVRKQYSKSSKKKAKGVNIAEPLNIGDGRTLNL
jgi:hypothetical protein